MCIAIIKPASAPLPTLEQLKNCADTNRDGGGLCYPIKGNKVQIVKGFKGADDMFAFLQTQDFSNVAMMIHFRIGTHGGKSDPKHTHPFPIGASTEQMEELMFVADSAVMHNGIMYKFGYDKAISDTMAFARDAFPKILEMPADARAVVLTEVLGTSNKIAMMDGDGAISKVGSWTEDGGLFWSNSSYKSYTAAADPRNWGRGSTGCQIPSTTGGKYKSQYQSRHKSVAQIALEDYEEQFGVPPQKNWYAPVKGQFWSEVIEDHPLDYDVEALRDAYLEFSRKRVNLYPQVVWKPADTTHFEWDVVLCYRYTYAYLSDRYWEEYIGNFRVLPTETEVEASVDKAFEDAVASTEPAPETPAVVEEPCFPQMLVGEQQFVQAD